MSAIKIVACAGLLAFVCSATASEAQAWRNCIPGSMGPGGCESMGRGGGQSMGPGGGLSMGPGGGLSMGPGGGQSMGPGGGQSMGPGGGKSLMRDRNRGLNPDTLRPYPDANPYGRSQPNYFDSIDDDSDARKRSVFDLESKTEDEPENR